MKSMIKFGSLVDHLPVGVKNSVLAYAREEGINDIDELNVKRRGTGGGKQELEEGERAEITYITSRRLDRDNEIVVPGGGIVTQFKQAPQVLWGHNYSLPPIGHDQWIEKDEFGWKAKTVYVETQDPSLANVVWDTVKHGSLKTTSIGFIPLQSVVAGHADWDKVVRRLQRDWKEFTDDVVAATRRIITKWLLLEHSKVSVPANIDAATLAVAKQAGADSMILHDLGWDALQPKPEEKEEQPPEEPSPSRSVSVVPPRHVAKVARHVVPVSDSEVVREVLELERGRI